MMDGALPVMVPAVLPVGADTARPTAPVGDTGARYSLQPGLDLIAAEHGNTERPETGLLLSRRPLMAMRLNAQGFALVRALSNGGASAEDAARATGVSPVTAASFLDRLTDRRILVRTPPVPARWPRVSIIIAARGRHTSTRSCVTSLLVLDYPGPPPEIIVVDDASEPPLAPALAGLPIRLIRLERNAGQSAARNLAATEADGELLAFIDNDCLADPSWLRALIPYLGDPRLAIVGGRVCAPPASGCVAAFEAVRSPLDMGSIVGRVGPDEVVAYLPTCNLVIRRNAFLAAGGFVPEMRLGEDVDLTWRVLRTGARAWYAPFPHVIHHHRERLGALLRRRTDYASSEAELQLRHPQGHRVMPMPRTSLLALAALSALPLSAAAALALTALVAAMLAQEAAGKHRRLARLGVAVSTGRVAAAVLREHGASMYGLSANVIRYYGLPLLGLAGLFPALLPAAGLLFVVAPAIDHHRLKPACGFAVFVGLSWLEMSAYQLGVWRGCFARRTFRPLLPKLHWRR